MFLKGGFEDGVQFMGIYNDFRDSKLTKSMLQDTTVKNLQLFNKQIGYLNSLIDLCEKSETSGEWEGFYGKKGFWGMKGDEKGKNFDEYADEFRIKYGNKDFTEILKAQKGQIGENPEGWGGKWKGNILLQEGFLQKLLKLLMHPTYQRKKIILQASEALHKIFKERVDELNAKKDELLEELIRLLQELEGIGIAREKVIRKFESLLKRKKMLILRELEKNIADLVAESGSVLADYEKLSTEQEQVFGKIDPEYLARMTTKLVNERNLHLSFEGRQLATGQFLRKNDIRGLTLTGLADKFAERLQVRKVSLERFEHLSEEDIKYLQNLIPRMIAMIKRLTIVYNLIKIEMKKGYVEVEIKDLDFNNRKNKDFEFSHIKRVINKLV